MRQINGLVKTNDGYEIKNFLDPASHPFKISDLKFESYIKAVHALSGRLYPESYTPYLLAVAKLEPTSSIWDNLIFLGHAYGKYDHSRNSFISANQLGMDSSSKMEIAYRLALDETYKSLRSMVSAVE